MSFIVFVFCKENGKYTKKLSDEKTEFSGFKKNGD